MRALGLDDEPGIKSIAVVYQNETETEEEDECCWQELDIPAGQYIIGMRAGTNTEKTIITRLDLFLGGTAESDTEESQPEQEE